MNPLNSGMVHVNDTTINEPLIAFGSGTLERQMALEEFTTLKWISVQQKPRHYQFEAAAKA